MQSFKQFLAEIARAEGKNTHMTHIEDSVIYSGSDGAEAALKTIESLRDSLRSGAVASKTNITVKWDGAPAVFAGTDPSDGKFFVAKKGIFNKNPVVYKTPADIDADTTGDLNKKLKIALTELSKLGIKGVVQGDIMFTKGDPKVQEIEGEKYLTFHPNTIVYAVPAASESAKMIAQANLGVIFHTTYTGKSFESMTANYGVDISGFKRSPTIWFQDASLRRGDDNISESGALSQAETIKIGDSVKLARSIIAKIKFTLDDLKNNTDIAILFETFNNSLIRRGELIESPKIHIEKFMRWIRDKYKKETDEKKTPAGKDTVARKLTRIMTIFSEKNIGNLEMMIQLQNIIIETKGILIAKLNSLTKTSTFIRTASGFKPTNHEGFVAIDKLKGGAVKLVDRREFSRANFSADTIKGWQK